MKTIFFTLVLTTLCSLSLYSANAEGFHMVGSSTVYPYAKVVVDKLVNEKLISEPQIKITGTGKGLTQFCGSSGGHAPDITNASHRITKKKLRQCLDNRISVLEMMIGYDTIMLTQGSKSKQLQLSRKDLFLALAAKVPSYKGTKLIGNPYHYWDEINSTLPHRKIIIYGPPKGTGTYDTLKDKLLKPVSLNLKAYGGSEYSTIRSDKAYINDHERHKAVVPKLQKDQHAIGIFGRGTYMVYGEGLKLIPIDGIEPTPENAANLSYPLARVLYFYIRQTPTKNTQREKDLMTYVKTMMSEASIGRGGLCVKKGLVPLPSSMLNLYQLWLTYGHPLTLFDLRK